jgi:calcineurin-like phosphoesterase family protein
MATWFTSDTHFGHVNIIDYCKRPFNKPLQRLCGLCNDIGLRPGTKRTGLPAIHCTHPDVDRMNDTIVDNWNRRVAPEDTVYHLGDFAFGSPAQIRAFAERLNGRKVLIPGNHDRLKPAFYESVGFLVRREPFQVGSLVLTHHPPSFASIKDGIYLCGHVHEAWAKKEFVTKPRSVIHNVGVDVRGFEPVRLGELEEGLHDGLLE